LYGLSVGARELILVRHGESTANVAALGAERDGTEVADAPLRDADAPLTEVGVRQARAVGAWLRSLPDDAFPGYLWCSPFRRAVDTAAIAVSGQRTPLPPRIDERLRDRELGVLEALTHRGVAVRLPAEAARRARLGAFYYRPPGGEAWTDVALRIRSLLEEVDRDCDGSRVLVVAHDAVILLVRYVCERMTEPHILELARSEPLLNASITTLVRPGGVGRWTLGRHNDVGHLLAANAPITEHPGDPDLFPR
jgi:broad specificity phosphatase PhoE